MRLPKWFWHQYTYIPKTWLRHPVKGPVCKIIEKCTQSNGNNKKYISSQKKCTKLRKTLRGWGFSQAHVNTSHKPSEIERQTICIETCHDVHIVTFCCVTFPLFCASLLFQSLAGEMTPQASTSRPRRMTFHHFNMTFFYICLKFYWKVQHSAAPPADPARLSSASLSHCAGAMRALCRRGTLAVKYPACWGPAGLGPPRRQSVPLCRSEKRRRFHSLKWLTRPGAPDRAVRRWVTKVFAGEY